MLKLKFILTSSVITELNRSSYNIYHICFEYRNRQKRNKYYAIFPKEAMELADFSTYLNTQLEPLILILFKQKVYE